MIQAVTEAGFGGPPVTAPLAATHLELLLHGLVTGKHWLVSLPPPFAGGGWTLPPIAASAFSLEERLEFSGLFLMLAAYTTTDGAGDVCTTPYYHQLETTEMGQASARLGVAGTSLFAWRLLDVPALHHVRSIMGWLGMTSTLRPDFVGQDRNLAWVALESKGSARNTAAPAFVGGAKGQASAVATVLGTAVACNVASITMLRTTAGPIHAHVEDPPADEESADRLHLDGFQRAAIEEQRYGPFARAIVAGALSQPGALPDGRPARFFRLPGVGYLGLVERLAATIEQRIPVADDPTRREELADDVEGARSEVASGFDDHDDNDAGDGPSARHVRKTNTSGTSVIAGVEHDIAVTGDGIAIAVAQGLLEEDSARQPPNGPRR